MLKIVFLGPPGGGKGSQAQRVAPAKGIAHISTGDVLRQNMAEGTELGRAVQQIVEAGNLVPDHLMLDLVRDRLAKPDCEQGYILDGFPRTLPQAEALDQVVRLTHVVNIDVPEEEILRRLTGRRVCAQGHTTHLNQLKDGKCPQCGSEVSQRKDDLPETVKNRLAVYYELTAPLIAYYREKGILHDIDGNGSYEEIEAAVLRVLAL